MKKSSLVVALLKWSPRRNSLDKKIGKPLYNPKEKGNGQDPTHRR